MLELERDRPPSGDLLERREARLARGPFDVLIGEVDAILVEWRALLRPELGPGLPPMRLLDSMPEILPGLLRLARRGVAQVEGELRERIAREHGLTRREEGMPVLTLAAEWDALHRACAQVLARHGFVDDATDAALARLDALLDDAVGYTLRGYYRRELDTLRGRGLERRSSNEQDRRQGGDRRVRQDV